ncbi:hypothetical protein CPB83DRAFT_843434 [Crepidotus variabilis]|uniref:Uncharacterized protein n=1 Tax=Crepidotus variabilis TaxID=179855 RepID=A0A9P6EUB1_9AGAR|nr:hypothetical protein CPB83DRAFT_843434 [Crepidotus variabilis]
MPLFGRRRAAPRTMHHTTPLTTSHRTKRGGLFHRKDRDRVAGGYKAALANPNTTHAGRRHAKHELHSMGRSSHIPLMTRIKRTLGIRSTPRAHRTTATHTTHTRRTRY